MNANKILPPLPRDLPIGDNHFAPQWARFMEQLQRMLGTKGGLDWALADKTNANINEIGNRSHQDLQDIKGYDGQETEGQAVYHLTLEQVKTLSNLTSNGNEAILRIMGL